ncbi:DNA polymerase IV [Collinsella sp. AGMB00827]|uniref:DNA polymerase IV n=1 Tax=Collinsella ureilytica TaxID=2869515 RepID=A0ABS7ML06_9ACTN|nr:DNA polymerase IV [Collinsella urealyticum]MBY4798056.1 DNA polymerase IV [Collinsella urealyticum]
MKHANSDTAHALVAGLLGTWTGPAIGLLDLDAFFASVEQLDHPEWRNKPVIVGGSPSERGVVSTASYEARRFGVRSAMSSAQAERLCPDAIWTHGRFSRYREVANQVMAILAEETPYIDRVSIDEAFFDITPGRFSSESPVVIANRISSRVADLGITCSIGLGPNKTVAKIASEKDKPRGLTIVSPGTQAGFLAPLPVRAMSGIGERAEVALARLGIRTLGQLSQAPEEQLHPIFGATTRTYLLRARGEEITSVRLFADPEEPKSVSHERTFPHDLTQEKEIKAELAILATSVGKRLRSQGLAGDTVTVKLAFGFGNLHTAQRKLKHATDDEFIFTPVALELFDSLWHPPTPIRLAGIGISGFDHAADAQADLFGAADESGKAQSDLRNLSCTLDYLHERFGRTSVTFGRERSRGESVNESETS